VTLTENPLTAEDAEEEGNVPSFQFPAGLAGSEYFTNWQLETGN
jgi:hypothetical protein